MSVQIVSIQDADESQQKRAVMAAEGKRDEFFDLLRELLANTLRASCGAGKPWSIPDQLVQATKAWSDAAKACLSINRPDLLSADTIGRSLYEGVHHRLPEYANDELMAHWEEVGDLGVQRAEAEILEASLQLAASHLLGQAAQESRARDRLGSAAKCLEIARQKRRDYYARRTA